jgi:hypothetical protein
MQKLKQIPYLWLLRLVGLGWAAYVPERGKEQDIELGGV